ncbi:MAG: hypothetical protein AAF620_16745 [Bacteroidota bacterium]
MKKSFIVILIFLSSICLISSIEVVQQGTVSLEIINEDGTSKMVSFEWPFIGPPPIGSDSVLSSKVQNILVDNDIDCPPERKKVSDNIWKCGNGKKIRTNDKKLEALLTKVWNN